jgi:hypothetical protein
MKKLNIVSCLPVLMVALMSLGASVQAQAEEFGTYADAVKKESTATADSTNTKTVAAEETLSLNTATAPVQIKETAVPVDTVTLVEPTKDAVETIAIKEGAKADKRYKGYKPAKCGMLKYDEARQACCANVDYEILRVTVSIQDSAKRGKALSELPRCDSEKFLSNRTDKAIGPYREGAKPVSDADLSSKSRAPASAGAARSK